MSVLEAWKQHALPTAATLPPVPPCTASDPAVASARKDEDGQSTAKKVKVGFSPVPSVVQHQASLDTAAGAGTRRKLMYDIASLEPIGLDLNPPPEGPAGRPGGSSAAGCSASGPLATAPRSLGFPAAGDKRFSAATFSAPPSATASIARPQFPAVGVATTEPNSSRKVSTSLSLHHQPPHEAVEGNIETIDLNNLSALELRKLRNELLDEDIDGEHFSVISDDEAQTPAHIPEDLRFGLEGIEATGLVFVDGDSICSEEEEVESSSVVVEAAAGVQKKSTTRAKSSPSKAKPAPKGRGSTTAGAPRSSGGKDTTAKKETKKQSRPSAKKEASPPKPRVPTTRAAAAAAKQKTSVASPKKSPGTGRAKPYQKPPPKSTAKKTTTTTATKGGGGAKKPTSTSSAKPKPKPKKTTATKTSTATKANKGPKKPFPKTAKPKSVKKAVKKKAAKAPLKKSSTTKRKKK